MGSGHRTPSPRAPSLGVERVVAQVLSEIADEVTADEAVAEAPAAVDLLERVVVASGDHAPQPMLGGGLVHGEHRPRAGDAAVVVELENGVVRDVLRAQRAVVVDL